MGCLLSKSSNRRKSSLLEEHLRCGDWKEARSYLASPEGCREVQNLIGLISFTPGNRHRVVTPALWTGIFHRAPLDIIKTIFKLRQSVPQSNSEVKDLLHVALETMVDVDGQDEEDSRRSYDPQEHLDLIRFLVQSVCPSSSLKLTTCTFPGDDGTKRLYTPLGHALCLPISKTAIVRYLCFVCPEAIDVDCKLLRSSSSFSSHQEILYSPLALANDQAARNQSVGKNKNNNNNNNINWELILRGSDYYKENKISISFLPGMGQQPYKRDDDDEDLSLSTSPLPMPQAHVMGKAIETQVSKKDWRVATSILEYWHNNRDKYTIHAMEIVPFWVQEVIEKSLQHAVTHEQWDTVQGLLPVYRALESHCHTKSSTAVVVSSSSPPNVLWVTHQIEASLQDAVQRKEWYGVESILQCLSYEGDGNHTEPDGVQTARKQLSAYLEWKAQRTLPQE